MHARERSVSQIGLAQELLHKGLNDLEYGKRLAELARFVDMPVSKLRHGIPAHKIPLGLNAATFVEQIQIQGPDWVDDDGVVHTHE